LGPSVTLSVMAAGRSTDGRCWSYCWRWQLGRWWWWWWWW